MRILSSAVVYNLMLHSSIISIQKYSIFPGRENGCGSESQNIYTIDIENRIYREEFNGKKCKTAILLYCFHTAGVLHIFMVYNLLGPGISFYRKSKIIVKRKPNYEIGWFHNWPMIISHRLYAFKRWYSVIAL